MKRKVFSSLIFLLGAVMHICAQQVVVDNGVIKRGVDISNGHIVTSHYVLQANDMGFLNGAPTNSRFSSMVPSTQAGASGRILEAVRMVITTLRILPQRVLLLKVPILFRLKVKG